MNHSPLILLRLSLSLSQAASNLDAVPDQHEYEVQTLASTENKKVFCLRSIVVIFVSILMASSSRS
jgi:hypothetical protein